VPAGTVPPGRAVTPLARCAGTGDGRGSRTGPAAVMNECRNFTVMTHLQAAVNGDVDHPAMPKTAEEIAADAAACVEAGATLLHLHAFDEHGEETLEAGPPAVSNAQLVAAASAIVQGSEGELSTRSG